MAERRDCPPRCAASAIARPERDGQVAVCGALPGTPDPGGVRACEGEADGSACQVPRARGDVVEIAVRRGRSPAQCAPEVATPEDHDHPAAQGERPAAQDRESGEGGPGGCASPACGASYGPEGVVEEAVRHGCRAAQDPAPITASEVYDQVAVPGERPAAQGREGESAPDRDAGNGARQAARDRVRAVEEALRAQERAAGQAALGTQARPAARRARPRPHAAARARGAPRRAQPAARCLRLRTVRAALCAERRRGIHPRRDRGQSPQTRDRPSALAPELRVRVLAHGSVGAPGAPAVPQNALWDQLLGALPVRALCLLPPRATRCRVVLQPGGGGLARDAGRQPEALHAAVRARGRGDPRAPEQGDAAPCRRNKLARPGASRRRPVDSLSQPATQVSTRKPRIGASP